MEQLGDLTRIQGRIQRYYRASGSEDSQIGRHPQRVIAREDRNACCWRQLSFCEPSPNRFGHAPQCCIGMPLNLIVALDFDSDVIRPSLGTQNELVVKTGHSSW